MKKSARYQELFDCAPDGYIVTDALGVVPEANVAACELLQIETHFLVGKPLSSFIGHDDRATFRSFISRAAFSPRLDWESDVQPRVGPEFPASFTCTAGENGVLRWLMRDIGPRRAAENALYESNQTLRALVQAAPVSICIYELDGRIALWNPACERIFGWRAEEVVG